MAYSLDELRDEWKKDSKIDDSKLVEETIRIPNLHQKYLDILTEYKILLFKHDKRFQKMRGNRSRYYSGQMTKEELQKFGWEQYQYAKPLKTELERLLETDEIMLNLKDEYMLLKFSFEYCEEVMKSLKDRNFQIKHIIEWRKFESGD